MPTRCGITALPFPSVDGAESQVRHAPLCPTSEPHRFRHGGFGTDGTGRGHGGFCMCARPMSRVATLHFTTAVPSMARLMRVELYAVVVMLDLFHKPRSRLTSTHRTCERDTVGMAVADCSATFEVASCRMRWFRSAQGVFLLRPLSRGTR